MAWSTFEGVIITHTAKAVLFQSWYWEDGMWFPTSQVRWQEDGPVSCVIEVRDWLANKNGLLEFTQYTSQQLEVMRG